MACYKFAYCQRIGYSKPCDSKGHSVVIMRKRFNLGTKPIRYRLVDYEMRYSLKNGTNTSCQKQSKEGLFCMRSVKEEECMNRTRNEKRARCFICKKTGTRALDGPQRIRIGTDFNGGRMKGTKWRQDLVCVVVRTRGHMSQTKAVIQMIEGLLQDVRHRKAGFVVFSERTNAALRYMFDDEDRTGLLTGASEMIYEN
ncbi:hypothetical protein Tco_1220206 [Tanacetum coccineum]